MLKFKERSLGHRVLIKPEVEKETDWGFALTVSDRKAAMDSDKGHIVAMGPQAYKDYGDGSKWVEVGDYVYYAKYGAKVIKDDETGDLYIICNDEDVLLGLEAY